jgi:undecaprenyl-diphosphatase
VEYLFLGIVQGLTEFLPVSSQGHLLIFERLFHLNVNIAFDAVVHLGTALAAILYFRRDILALFTRERKILGMLLITTFVTGIIGIAFKDYFEALFSAFQYVGPFFIVTGLILLLGEWINKRSGGKKQAVGWLEAMVIGTAQGLAIIPSLSRSATTISAAMACNLDRGLAARYSFLASIPAILGAGVLQAKPIIKTGTLGIGFGPLLLGFIAAFLSGLLAIKLFMGLIQRTSLCGFAYYCFGVGVLVIILACVL